MLEVRATPFALRSRRQNCDVTVSPWIETWNDIIKIWIENISTWAHLRLRLSRQASVKRNWIDCGAESIVHQFHEIHSGDSATSVFIIAGCASSIAARSQGRYGRGVCARSCLWRRHADSTVLSLVHWEVLGRLARYRNRGSGRRSSEHCGRHDDEL